MILAVDLGKTSCRVAAGGRRSEGPGAPGLAAPGGVRGAEAAILAVARELGPVDEMIVGALAAAGGHAKTAIVALLAGVDAAEAAARLDRALGRVRDVLGVPTAPTRRARP